MSELKRTPLFDWHLNRGAKMVPFAGYEMPVQYAEGIVAEHQWTRSHAGLFDVSHMGQIRVRGADAAQALERLIPIDILGLEVGQQRYGLLTNGEGGIEDDLMLTRCAEDYLIVVNAACKDADFALLQAGLDDGAIAWWPERALLALQGPEAVAVLSTFNPQVADLPFMRGGEFELQGVRCWVSRSGYTGEDGFEISVPAAQAAALADALLSDERVAPVGLGARDSLRLEAGLCLYGNDIDRHTTPIEAGLLWSIQKVRRPGGERAGHYPGAERIGAQIENGAGKKRVGFVVEGKIPVRAGADIEDLDGKSIGHITSGGFSPSRGEAIAMGYLSADVIAANPEDLFARVRGKVIRLKMTPLPFVRKDYHK